MTIYHVANDPGFFSGNCFNARFRCGSVLYNLKSLFRTAGWQIKQTSDGDALWSDSTDVLTNTSYNQDDGAPDFNQIGVNSPKIAGSFNNAGAYMVIETPVSTPPKYRYQLLIYFIEAKSGSGVYSIRMQVRFCKGGYQNGTATVIPDPIVPKDDRIVLLGSIGSYFCYDGSAFDAFYWNFAVSDDVNNPFFWIEGHLEGGPSNNPALAFGDCVEDVPLNENGTETADGALVYFRGNVGLDSLALNMTEFITAEIDNLSYNGLGWATSFSGFSQAACATVYGVMESGGTRPLVDMSGFYGLGLNSRNSNREDLLYIEYFTPQAAAYINRGGYCGRSKNYKWHTKTNPARAHLSLGNNGSGVAWVLLGRVWAPFNNGASPGVNNVPFTL